MGEFTINDLRGEYWLYSEENLRVNVGRGGVSGVCHFNTSDVHLEAGGPLDSQKVSEILSKLMLKFGGPKDGYKRILLNLDGKYILTHSHITAIDQVLSKLGFKMFPDSEGKKILWIKNK